MSHQLSFFDSPPVSEVREGNVDQTTRAERISKISWSYSRRAVMEKCLRNYYYEYYGGNKRTASLEPNKQLICQLKQLKNRYARTGEILHLVISTYLRKAKQDIIWDENRLVSWAKDLFSKDISFSQSNTGNWIPTNEKYPPSMLSEFYYQDPTALNKCLSSQDRLVAAITSFMNDPLYSEFRQKGSQDNSTVEGFIKIRPHTPCLVDGRVDLAYIEDSKATIVDWKLGNEDGIGDDSLQLAAYGLWAVESLKCRAESIRICKVHFSSHKIVNFECNSQVLNLARARIMQDAERMAFLEGYGKNACVEAFTPCRQTAICQQCSFLAICDDSKETTYA
jgi:hypothetical protein